MNPSVYIFGTCHSLQCGNKDKYSKSTLDEFCEYLHRIIEQHGIAFIAEEMTRSMVCRHSGACADETIAARIAQERNIRHCYIDMACQTTTNLCILPEQLAAASKRLATPGHNSEILYELDFGHFRPSRPVDPASVPSPAGK